MVGRGSDCVHVEDEDKSHLEFRQRVGISGGSVFVQVEDVDKIRFIWSSAYDWDDCSSRL